MKFFSCADYATIESTLCEDSIVMNKKGREPVARSPTFFDNYSQISVSPGFTL